MPLPFTRVPSASRAGVVGACMLFASPLASACGGGNDDDETSATVNEAGTSLDDASATGAESSGGSTGAGTSTSGGESEESSSGPITGLDSTTDTMGWTYCDPPTAAFTGMPLVASLDFDFDAETCSSVGGPGGAPNLFMEIQDSGLIDVTAYGLEITDASAGLLFEDPPQGDSQVIDLYPQFVIRLEATVISTGSPISIEFQVTEKGPLLDDARVDFG